jgi:hypothetical protein
MGVGKKYFVRDQSKVSMRCALLGCCAAYSGSLLPTFRDVLVPPHKSQAVQCSWYCLYLDDVTDRLSRNFGNKLPLYAVQHPRRAQISFTRRWKPEITHQYVLTETLHVGASSEVSWRHEPDNVLRYFKRSCNARNEQTWIDRDVTIRYWWWSKTLVVSVELHACVQRVRVRKQR